jgi:aspartate aminotransferase-like enzyme
MIGHRSTECADLIARIQEKIRKVFYTESRVFITAASGTGLQEAAVRNCSESRILNCVNGAFADRWRKVTLANGKKNSVLEVDWGNPILPEQVADTIRLDRYEAVTIVHNETSTGVISPIKDVAQAIRNTPGGDDIIILVDSVSGLAGTRVDFDAWDIDVVITSSQKAFALPPGIALCAVSDRAMAKARTVPNRGYYFDFLELEKYLLRNQTPSTPPISLLFALDIQLTDILNEGMEERFSRHTAMRDKTITWAIDKGFCMFSAPGYESPTVSCIRNELDISVVELLEFLRSRNMIISNGYGPLKESSFRIAHMGDTQLSDLEELLEAIDAFLKQSP